MLIKYEFRDAIHTHFVTLIGKWTISFLPTHQVFLSSLLRDVTKILYFSLAILSRLSARYLTHPSTIVHLPISVAKWVWMASLNSYFISMVSYQGSIDLLKNSIQHYQSEKKWKNCNFAGFLICMLLMDY